MLLPRYFLVILLLPISQISAETWTLTDKKGRSIEVEDLAYNGTELYFKRVGDYRQMSITPDLLTEKSWNAIVTEFGKQATIKLEVDRSTKTKRDSETTYSSLSYTSKSLDVTRLNEFEIEISSTSFFQTDLKIVYFIFAEDQIDYGQTFKEVSRNNPIKIQLSKTLSHQEYKSSSTYGYNYKRKYGSSKAGLVVHVFNVDGDEMNQAATPTSVSKDYEFFEAALKKKLDLLPQGKDARQTFYKGSLIN